MKIECRLPRAARNSGPGRIAGSSRKRSAVLRVPRASARRCYGFLGQALETRGFLAWYPRLRRWLRPRRIDAVVPQRTDWRAQQRGRPFKLAREAYRRSNGVERCRGWLKENRRVVVPREKAATDILGMQKLAIFRAT